jgi:hypothetical protein
VAGALAQVGEVGALDHDVRAAERRQPQASDGVTLGVAPGLEPRELSEAPLDVALARHDLLVGRHLLVQAVQLVPKRGLVAARHQRRYRLLPGQRQPRIEQQKHAAAHQHGRHKVEGGA